MRYVGEGHMPPVSSASLCIYVFVSKRLINVSPPPQPSHPPPLPLPQAPFVRQTSLLCSLDITTLPTSLPFLTPLCSSPREPFSTSPLYCADLLFKFSLTICSHQVHFLFSSSGLLQVLCCCPSQPIQIYPDIHCVTYLVFFFTTYAYLVH